MTRLSRGNYHAITDDKSIQKWQAVRREWALDGLTLFDRNLIVGKNASGKSRTIGVISSLARHFGGLAGAGVVREL